MVNKYFVVHLKTWFMFYIRILYSYAVVSLAVGSFYIGLPVFSEKNYTSVVPEQPAAAWSVQHKDTMCNQMNKRQTLAGNGAEVTKWSESQVTNCSPQLTSTEWLETAAVHDSPHWHFHLICKSCPRMFSFYYDNITFLQSPLFFFFFFFAHRAT